MAAVELAESSCCSYQTTTSADDVDSPVKVGDVRMSVDVTTTLNEATDDAVTSDDVYECGLDEKTLKKAEQELKEVPRDRLSAVGTLRQWVNSQQHIRCPKDVRFLLSFLRVRYFSQLDARKLLENFLTRRTKFPQWFKNLDTCDPKILSVLDDGVLLILPERDEDGRKIFIVRPSQVNVSGDALYTKHDVFRAFACVVDSCYLVDEMTSVNGTVVIVDMGDVTLKHVSHLNNDERKDFLGAWQGSYPARVKQLHIYNTGTVAEILLQVFKFCMSEKIQNRLKIHGQQLSSLYKEVAMNLLPVEYLPDDYNGPNAGTKQQIIDHMKSELKRDDVRSRLLYLSSDQFGIDVDSITTSSSQLSTTSSSSSSVTYDGSSVDGVLQCGSFRKLELD